MYIKVRNEITSDYDLLLLFLLMSCTTTQMRKKWDQSLKADIAMRKRRLWAFVLILVLAVGLPVPAAGSMGKAGAGVTVSAGGYHTAVLQGDGSL